MLEKTFAGYKINSIVATALGLFVVLAFSLLSSSSVIAQTETAEELKVTTKVALTSPDYRFTAQPCDSLTKLVRRAIIIFDEANNDVEISQAGIIYAETNIVQNMGAYLLDIGDEVIVSGQEVVKYTANSQSLSKQQVAAWQAYVPLVDFDLEDTQEPENIDEIIEVISDQVDKDEAVDVDDVENEDEDSVSMLWWFAGIGSVTYIWYLLWKREDTSTE